MTRPQSRTRRMSNNYNDIPIGILAIQKFSRKCCPHFHWNKQLLFKSSILGITYIAYTCYHMTRKPIAVLKPELLNCSTTHTHNETTDCGYAPFVGPDAAAIFGAMDSAFLFSYALAMFASGFIAERVSLRYFLAFGMMFSGVFTYLFGVAKPLNIHSTSYFLLVQICAGIFQTTGWPGVVTLVGRWFGKSKRGLIFGIWNSHTSIGNILGTLIAAYYIETDWSNSFIVPGIIMALVGFLLFLFVVDAPEIVGLQTQRGVLERRPSNDSDIEESGADGSANTSNYDADIRNYSSNVDSEINYRPTERTPILANPSASITASMQRPIGLLDALYIPGVIEFSLCLFFSKLVSYTFLYWLPLYIQSSSTLGPSHSAELSTSFDVGGIIGAIVAGMLSDYTGMSATTCTVMLFFASPVLLMYQQYGTISATVSILLLGTAGILVNGPYALITTSVSAELGQHSSLEGNAKALATVTAIIDGTGSIGAAIGPLLAGVISTSHGWQDVFYMLIIADILAMLLLLRLVMKEFGRLRRTSRIRIE